MMVDLFMLIIFGCILEAACTKVSGFVLSSVPSASISFLIVYMAVCRWNLWGLITVPFLALATFVGGRFFADMPYHQMVYDWRMYISTILGLSTIGLDVIIFRKCSAKKINMTNWKMIGILVLNYVLFSFVHFIVYRLLTAGTLLHTGSYIYEYYNTITNELEVVNVFSLGENGFIYNLFGLAVSIIGCFILRSQGVLVNVIEKLIEDKKNAEINNLDYENSLKGKIINTDASLEDEEDSSSKN